MTATFYGWRFFFTRLVVDARYWFHHLLFGVFVSDNASSSLKSADWVIWTPVGIAVGIACGAVLGVALGPAGVWLSLGLALGVTAGVMFGEYHFSRRLKEVEGGGAVSPSAASEDSGEAPTRVLAEASPEPLPAAPEPLPEVPEEAVTVPVRQSRAPRSTGAAKGAAKAPAKTATPRKAPARRMATAAPETVDPIL